MLIIKNFEKDGLKTALLRGKM
jgi:hypothetical protein